MTQALYRRYRPDTFNDVIGQEHVTDALKTALATSRVAHAYLFSGPRGCGKTTSARILARSLNCESGPTPTPCGTCASCIDLGAGGSGSLDVVEIDAASHNGVDDARSLRERAEFAPSRDRYRIFILDEAHMVTTQGFNALLKLVEEPPDHVKFIFATTEPEKVITTIRSRTHHYPFRLVPPATLIPYLQGLCDSEGVVVADGVLPLVARVGGGSVRDSLSVLDQLIAGSDGEVALTQATSLLGFTDAALLDKAIDTLGAGDGAGAFAVVEQIVDSGHEPRRFAEDLLQRMRDLIVCALAGPDRAADILVGTPPDQLARMMDQSATWGTRLLSRRADLVEEALREMTGATSPRLQLELLLARLLVTSGDAGGAATAAEPTATSEAPVQPARPRTARTPAVPAAPAVAAEPIQAPENAAPVASVTATSSPAPAGGVDAAGTQQPAPESSAQWSGNRGGAAAPPQRAVAPEPVQAATPAPGTPSAAPGGTEGPTQDEVRNKWGQLLEAVGKRSAMLGPLLGATRGVNSVGTTVRFTLAEDSYVRRLQGAGGETILGEVLSELFSRPLTAEAGTAATFAARATEPEPQTHPAAEEPTRAETPTAEPTRAETAPAEPTSAATPSTADDARDNDARYESMLATDRVLDILGGRVVEEIIEENDI